MRMSIWRDKPTVAVDFTVPVEGREAPWGMAKLVFFHDTARLAEPPRSAAELAAFIAENPGRFTYPQPPDYMGTTFLKQLLADLAPDPSVLSRPVDEAAFEPASAPLFAWLDAAHPNLWRQGRTFPAEQRRPPPPPGRRGDRYRFRLQSVRRRRAPSRTASCRIRCGASCSRAGTLGNTHFVAIPYNANAKAGAMVFADFLMSPEAQARKEDVQIWGDPTVLDVAALPAEDKARFAALDLGVATLRPEELGPVLPEPHPSWVKRLETEWAKRYGVLQ